MQRLALTASLLMLLPCPTPAAENPWRSKVPAAVERAYATRTAGAFADALDVAWRADDWERGLELARRAQRDLADEPALRSRVARALYRAGLVIEAETLADKLDSSDDAIALRMRLGIELARGRHDEARRWAERLAGRAAPDGEDIYQLYSAAFVLRQSERLADLARKAERSIDPNNGYPDILVSDAVQGLSAFHDATGPQPLNQVVAHGSAPLTPLVMIGLPAVQIEINGRGPYRLVLDTGGSIMLSLDETVAEELGLKSIAPASVRGVSGRQETGQVLFDQVTIGSIRCRRVMGRTFDVRSALFNSADGIIGTGIFADSRITLDFVDGRLTVSPSTDEPGPGVRTDARIIGDAKVMALVELGGQPAVAMLDSGADAIALAPSKLERLFPDRHIPRYDPGLALGVGGDDTPQIAIGPGVEMKLGGRTFPNYGGLGLDVLDTLISPVLGVQTNILLGMPLFRETRRVTIDFPRAQLWIEWAEHARGAEQR
ncbi:MAG: aspartyl protease family protein [Phycisphaerales bacterium]|nr:aspartyl protease family protein [Phycisphaerales bacterium]